MLCEGALRAVNFHSIKTPSSSFAQGGPCLSDHLASISCRPTTMTDNEQYDKEKNFEDKCRLAPEIQGRRTGPAQKGEHPAR